MERVLIVAKTRMGSFACVGGLTCDTNKSIRLLRPDGSNQPADTPFDVGQVWALEFHQPSKVTSPHVEDVLVTKKKFVGQQSNLRNILLQRVQPWRGGPEQLFDGLFVIENTRCYICRSRGIPNCSTGYWLANAPISLNSNYKKQYYELKHEFSARNRSYQVTLSIPYVGFAAPIPIISADTLIRVSLARWWQSIEMSEERCYLQLSGWYL